MVFNISLNVGVKPRLHQIHVAVYNYHGIATRIRIKVDTCRRDNSVADTGYNVDGDRRYKWIQVDTTCIRATCIRCKRGIIHQDPYILSHEVHLDQLAC